MKRYTDENVTLLRLVSALRQIFLSFLSLLLLLDMRFFVQT